MATKLTRLTHKMVMHLHLVAESCIICNSCSRQPVWKILDTPSYTRNKMQNYSMMNLLFGLKSKPLNQ